MFDEFNIISPVMADSAVIAGNDAADKRQAQREKAQFGCFVSQDKATRPHAHGVE
ncbi:MAG: hypothetical protein Tsb002_29940 [Wenzhouxiangellaceae bacterium]